MMLRILKKIVLTGLLLLTQATIAAPAPSYFPHGVIVSNRFEVVGTTNAYLGGRRIATVNDIGGGSTDTNIVNQLINASTNVNARIANEGDPIWMSASNFYYTKVLADTLFSTGTPLYVESDPVWSSVSNTIWTVSTNEIRERILADASISNGLSLAITNYGVRINGEGLTNGSDITISGGGGSGPQFAVGFSGQYVATNDLEMYEEGPELSHRILWTTGSSDGDGVLNWGSQIWNFTGKDVDFGYMASPSNGVFLGWLSNRWEQVYLLNVFATGTPLYVESDPVWTANSNAFWLVITNNNQQRIDADAAISNELAGKLSVETDPIWTASSNTIWVTMTNENWKRILADGSISNEIVAKADSNLVWEIFARSSLVYSAISDRIDSNIAMDLINAKLSVESDPIWAANSNTFWTALTNNNANRVGGDAALSNSLASKADSNLVWSTFMLASNKFVKFLIGTGGIAITGQTNGNDITFTIDGSGISGGGGEVTNLYYLNSNNVAGIGTTNMLGYTTLGNGKLLVPTSGAVRIGGMLNISNATGGSASFFNLVNNSVAQRTWRWDNGGGLTASLIEMGPSSTFNAATGARTGTTYDDLFRVIENPLSTRCFEEWLSYSAGSTVGKVMFTMDAVNSVVRLNFSSGAYGSTTTSGVKRFTMYAENRQGIVFDASATNQNFAIGTNPVFFANTKLIVNGVIGSTVMSNWFSTTNLVGVTYTNATPFSFDISMTVTNDAGVGAGAATLVIDDETAEGPITVGALADSRGVVVRGSVGAGKAWAVTGNVYQVRTYFNRR